MRLNEFPPGRGLAPLRRWRNSMSLQNIPHRTPHPDQAWMQQTARNATYEAWESRTSGTTALHDRDTKFCSVFQGMLKVGGLEPIQLPARRPI
jgi:hypothetical protein